jgi:signal transduction histidine kinase
MYDPLAEERGAQLSSIVRAASAVVGHRQLAQAVSNLIENAIRYGSTDGKIRVKVDRVDAKSGSRSAIAGREFRRTARRADGASAASIFDRTKTGPVALTEPPA